MLITTVTIQDYKRVRKVAITPDADRHVILIGGKNGAGKSSTLDALTAAFGGARAIADDPVRHGADEASIFIELDGGRLTIDRVIDVDGKSKLEVRDREGAVRQPQKVLDALVGARFLNPLAFLALPAKEQRAQLMKLIPDAARIVELDASRDRGFARRTEVGRELARAEGELSRLPEIEVGRAIDVAALTEESAKLAELQRKGDGLGSIAREADAALKSATERMDREEQRIAEIEHELEQARLEYAQRTAHAKECSEKSTTARAAVAQAAKEWADLAPRRSQLDAELATAADHNRAVYAAETQARRRVEADSAVKKLTADQALLTEGLAKVDARKAAILATAKLPVEGLAIGDDGILLGGVPFAQASDAERLRVALALAIAGSPELGDVWIHDGALLDDDSLELVAKHAAAAGKRVWIERVGSKDPGVIVIQDGQVAK